MPSISLNGIDINYRDEGEGEALLMVHNLTSNIRGFDRNFPVLSKKFRTVAADIRGHGLTTHEEDYDKAVDFYTFDNMAQDQVALLDNLGIDKFYLFGQAYWGANTALHLFERIPDRVKGIIISSSYMIVNDHNETAYDKLGEVGRDNFIRMHKLAREKGMMAVYQDRIDFGQFWGPKVLSSPDILKEFIPAHEQTSPVGFVTVPRLPRAKRENISRMLQERNMPLMLIMGEQEKENNRELFIQEMRADYPGTQTILLPDCGHYPTIENPHDFNSALINFYAGAARYPKG